MNTNKPFEFSIKDYQKKKPFSSFLSGIAGKMGIPIWAFYVNRGQLISSFGIRDKNGSITEFYPANLAYHYTPTMGFRTFIKVDGYVHECFKEENKNQEMTVRYDQVSIKEMITNLDLSIKVTYFTLPNENLGALVRKVEIESYDANKEIEIIDGLAQILPSGVDYGGYKAISNLLQSWMSSIHESDYVFYKLRASTDDSAEVNNVVDGNFYKSVGLENAFYISDYKLIFDEDTSLKTPYQFNRFSLDELSQMSQTHVNQVPCAMTAAKIRLDHKKTFFSLIGYTKQKETIDSIKDELSFEKLLSKETENQDLHEDLVSSIETKTAFPIFDAYLKQCFLDNTLRGGTPIVFDTLEGKVSYYLYSRKHGDLERDYNFFHLEPNFYSQGNGNFRDVLQNRRNDIFFNPEIGHFNIHQFASLIQADGYNPLQIEGITFTYHGDKESLRDDIKEIVSKEFTPGMLANKISLKSKHVEQEIRDILKFSKPHIKASFGEGYWEDHFTYIYDLIESFLSIYPDKKEELMFNQTHAFFKSPAYVLPRDEKYVLTKDKKIRQYGSLVHGHGKSEWLSNQEGILKINLFGKLLTLSLNKFGHLDDLGIGLSYEANKPGWNDAANGIPGLFGSGVSEMFELKRIIELILGVAKSYPKASVSLLKATHELGCAYFKDKEMLSFDSRMQKLEKYREQLKEQLDVDSYPAETFIPLLELMNQKLEQAIVKAREISPIYPTYLIYDAISYKEIQDEKNNPKIGNYGLPTVKVETFKVQVLPHFLEAPARYLKSLAQKDEAKKIYEAVKKTGLYDSKLKMYQTSESLEAYSNEIGRLRAFTAGWLERESNFLHMTYKYLLGILKSGLYEEFYEEIKTNYTCFMNPEVYGRSPVENSSFIATSSNPDPKKHGQGFVSRLTGSTAEVLSMWRYMFIGDKLFHIDNKQLSFKLSPKLHHSFFTDGMIETTLFGKIKLRYFNEKNLNTYDSNVSIKSMKIYKNQEVIDVLGSEIKGDIVLDIRDLNVHQIDVYY